MGRKQIQPRSQSKKQYAIYTREQDGSKWLLKHKSNNSVEALSLLLSEHISNPGVQSRMRELDANSEAELNFEELDPEFLGHELDGE